jgi:hypothetical protein
VSKTTVNFLLLRKAVNLSMPFEFLRHLSIPRLVFVFPVSKIVPYFESSRFRADFGSEVFKK